MNYKHLHYKIALTLLQGIGPIKAKEILLNLERHEAFFELSPNELCAQTGLKKSFVQKTNRKEALKGAVRVVEHLEKNNIQVHYFQETSYPRRLKNCVDSPLILYSQANVDFNFPKVVAIVGTRNATSYGKRLCEELLNSFRGQDILVVSGLATGIDAQVHKNCVDLNIATVGVLGHGLDRLYPSQNRSLSESMKNFGGLLTEFIPGTTPDRENFPKRNRIVAGMSDATIVIESNVKGGSLITANLANDYNRDVFAYPGSVHKRNVSGL